MKSIKMLLADHPFFNALDPAYRDVIARCARDARFLTDESIFEEGNPADEFYLIGDGQVAIEAQSLGRGPLVVETLFGGDVLGWSWLFPPYRWHLGARATCTTDVTVFDGKCLREKCNQDHDLGYALMMQFSQIISRRLQATRLQLLDLHDSQRSPMHV